MSLAKYPTEDKKVMTLVLLLLLLLGVGLPLRTNRHVSVLGQIRSQGRQKRVKHQSTHGPEKDGKITFKSVVSQETSSCYGWVGTVMLNQKMSSRWSLALPRSVARSITLVFAIAASTTRFFVIIRRGFWRQGR